MTALAKVSATLGTLDRLAEQHSCVHNLDPRAKIVATLAFVLTVMSFQVYTVSALLPLLFFPLTLAALGGIPLGLVWRRVLMASPFVIGVGIFNPWLDAAPMLHLAGVDIAAGWISFASILLRFTLTVSAVVVLVALTGFTSICASLPSLGLPKVLAVQLLFLYRYIFVLIEEAARMQRARELRSMGKDGLTLRSCASLLGQLLLRTVDRAGRIHRAMVCRGFNGDIPLHTPLRFTRADALFLLFWLSFFALTRFVHLPLLLEKTLNAL